MADPVPAAEGYLFRVNDLVCPSKPQSYSLNLPPKSTVGDLRKCVARFGPYAMNTCKLLLDNRTELPDDATKLAEVLRNRPNRAHEVRVESADESKSVDQKADGWPELKPNGSRGEPDKNQRLNQQLLAITAETNEKLTNWTEQVFQMAREEYQHSIGTLKSEFEREAERIEREVIGPLAEQNAQCMAERDKLAKMLKLERENKISTQTEVNKLMSSIEQLQENMERINR